MADSEGYLFRAPPAKMQRWKNEARKAGVSFSVWLREAADAKATNNDPPTRARPDADRTQGADPSRPVGVKVITAPPRRFRPDFKTGQGDVR